jgi:DNA-binding Lrp family transcriptional regulator
MNEVTFAGFVTGNFDIIIQVVVRSQEALVKFLTVTLARVEGVKSTETFVMPYEIKRATSWILPEEPTDQSDDLLDDIDYDDLIFEQKPPRR